MNSLHGTTLGDLSDAENVRQAEHELSRATTDAALADWARRWGDAIIYRLWEARPRNGPAPVTHRAKGVR